MTVTTIEKPAANTWVKPELVRLGKIADVAGPQTGTSQNASKS